MPFRFRKSFGPKGFKINLSKSGIGTSVGVPGLHISNGPRGPRATASLPGTGLSYSESLRSKNTKTSKQSNITSLPKLNSAQIPIELVNPPANKSINRSKKGMHFKPWQVIVLMIGSLFTGCLVCFGIMMVIALSGDFAKSTPVISTDPVLAIPPSSTPVPITQTPTPSLTPSPTITPSSPPTLTFTPTPSLTPIPSITPITRSGSAYGACTCTGPDLNCKDFASSQDAQACYDNCKSLGFGDFYHLDANHDGRACQ